jgi:crossover junction endodeoxyribonuclease RusA
MRVSLPWPPTVNTYWRMVRGRMLISAKGREYRNAVCMQLAESPLFKGRLKIEILAMPPDKRRRDLDNLLKAPLDALQWAGVIQDDSQFDEIHLIRGDVEKDGCLVVAITKLGES